MAILVLSFVLTASMIKKHKNSAAVDMKINIYHADGNHLASEDDIREKLKSIPDSVLFNLNENEYFNIEQSLASSSLIRQVDMYKNLKNEVIIDVYPKQPLLRIIDNKNHHYFMDKNGNLFRCSGKSANVPVVSGHLSGIRISDTYNTMISFAKHLSLRENIFSMIQHINKNSLLKNLIDQIYITSDHQFELIPKIGKHYVEFGNCENMNEKFTKLISFYKHGLSNLNWTKYERINLKYKNQVICTKK